MDMYTEVYRSYDATNKIISFSTDSRIRRLAAEEILKSRPRRVLDIATGTGGTAIKVAKLAERQGRRIEVTAVDANASMLSMARGNARRENAMVTFEKGDALNLRYPDEDFDAAVCTFAVKNFDSLDRFAREAHRVLKKNGVLVVADISIPEGPLNRLAFRLYAGYIGLIGLLSGKQLYRWLPGSARSFDKARLMKILERRHFQNPSVREFFFGIAYIITYRKR